MGRAVLARSAIGGSPVLHTEAPDDGAADDRNPGRYKDGSGPVDRTGDQSVSGVGTGASPGLPRDGTVPAPHKQLADFLLDTASSPLGPDRVRGPHTPMTHGPGQRMTSPASEH